MKLRCNVTVWPSMGFLPTHADERSMRIYVGSGSPDRAISLNVPHYFERSTARISCFNTGFPPADEVHFGLENARLCRSTLIFHEGGTQTTPSTTSQFFSGVR